jgi:hypothetical protein
MLRFRTTGINNELKKEEYDYTVFCENWGKSQKPSHGNRISEPRIDGDLGIKIIDWIINCIL